MLASLKGKDLTLLMSQSDMNHSRGLIDVEFTIERGANLAAASSSASMALTVRISLFGWATRVGGAIRHQIGADELGLRRRPIPTWTTSGWLTTYPISAITRSSGRANSLMSQF